MNTWGVTVDARVNTLNNGTTRQGFGVDDDSGELLQNEGKFTGIKFFDTNGKVIFEQNMMQTKK
ncbi:MAG: hypothetical protein MUF45_16775 [Spirosomaceae bacterium]|jgi:hypothetical protein|nr:hypothetical protein [Spirosomataceae bacterium]